MKRKSILLSLSLTLILASCSSKDSSNVNTSKTNVNANNTLVSESNDDSSEDANLSRKSDKDNEISKDTNSTKNTSSTNNKTSESANENESMSKEDLDDWREKLVKFGQFNQEFVNNLDDQKIIDLVKFAQNKASQTGYWDVKDFVFQELSKQFPNESSKFPLDSVEAIYDWKISENDQNTNLYTNERNALIKNGYNKLVVNSISNQKMKEAFQKAYQENDEAYYKDYILSAMKILEDEFPNKQDQENYQDNTTKQTLYDKSYYDQFRKDMVTYYGFDANVVKNISDYDIDLASQRAQKRLEETGYGDSGLIYQELAKMYPGSSTIYPGN